MPIDRETIRALPDIGIGEVIIERNNDRRIMSSRERKLGILYGMRYDLRAQMRLAEIQGRTPTTGQLAAAEALAEQSGPGTLGTLWLAEMQSRRLTLPRDGILGLIYTYEHGDEAAADALAAEF